MAFNLLLKFKILDILRKKNQIPKQNWRILCRSLITQETPGVYSFGPDLNPHNETQIVDKTNIESADEIINSFKDANSEIHSNSFYERPTPVIFVSGEALSADIWFSTANYFSRRGFSGLLLSLPHDSQLMNIDNAADYLEKKRSEFGLTPPVIVAHSISSFIAQKYLESYSLKGLVLINPIPPVHTETVRNLLENEKYCRLKIDNNDDSVNHINYDNDRNNKNGTIKDLIADNCFLTPFSQLYYNIKDPIEMNIGTHVYQTNSFPTNFMKNLVTDKEATLRLEKGVVPILIVSTTGDSILNSNLTGSSTPILNRESLHSIADFHGVDTKHIVILDSESRAPMLSVETAGAFNKIVYDWIDDL